MAKKLQKRQTERGKKRQKLNRANARMTIFAAPGDYETGDREA
jgi:hypothetical protein